MVINLLDSNLSRGGSRHTPLRVQAVVEFRDSSMGVATCALRPRMRTEGFKSKGTRTASGAGSSAEPCGPVAA